jgi:hypothetical protein
VLDSTILAEQLLTCTYEVFVARCWYEVASVLFYSLHAHHHVFMLAGRWVLGGPAGSAEALLPEEEALPRSHQGRCMCMLWCRDLVNYHSQLLLYGRCRPGGGMQRHCSPVLHDQIHAHLCILAAFVLAAPARGFASCTAHCLLAFNVERRNLTLAAGCKGFTSHTAACKPFLQALPPFCSPC